MKNIVKTFDDLKIALKNSRKLVFIVSVKMSNK